MAEDKKQGDLYRGERTMIFVLLIVDIIIVLCGSFPVFTVPIIFLSVFWLATK